MPSRSPVHGLLTTTPRPAVGCPGVCSGRPEAPAAATATIASTIGCNTLHIPGERGVICISGFAPSRHGPERKMQNVAQICRAYATPPHPPRYVTVLIGHRGRV